MSARTHLREIKEVVQFHLQSRVSSVVLVIIIALWAATIVANVYVPSLMERATLHVAQRHAVEAIEQMRIVRQYYLENVVKKVTAEGTFTMTMRHREDPHGVPLPTTMVKDISRLLENRDMAIKLVSPFPWPQRVSRKLDDFQIEAWKAFQAGATDPFTRLELLNGSRIMRVALPDRMTTDSCVQCHNRDPDSPYRSWRVNDIRGVMEVATNIEPELAETSESSRTVRLAILLLVVLTTAVLLLAIRSLRISSEEKAASDNELKFLAEHDPMTGALNRASFMRRFSAAVEDQRIRGKPCSVLFVDLDKFKDVNDTMGHGAGDDLIRYMAEVIDRSVAPSDIFARLGGDEFVIARIGQDPVPLAASIVEELSKPIPLAGQELRLGASIGIATEHAGVIDPGEFLRRADVALYEAKELGRGRYVLYAPELDNAIVERRRMENTIREALEHERFEVHYQPVWRLIDGALLGFEALVRMRDAEGKLVSPAQFIPLAEEMGLVVQIGTFVLNEACREAAQWPLPLRIAVNLSPAQLRRGKGDSHRMASETVKATLAATGLAASRLELEITEGMLLENTESILNELHAIKAMGAAIAMDDFGTGFSSLSYLWKFPFDKVKIDRSFFNYASSGTSRATAVLKKIIELGASLNMRITAEGIEQPEQAVMLREMGCGEVQGYLFGKPMPSTDISGLIMREYQRRLALEGKAELTAPAQAKAG